MKNVLFIAPPAAGKGTQSDMLVKNYGYVHISTGDLLRNVDINTDLGKRIREIQASGHLVEDEIVFRLLEDKLKSIKGNHFLLDGCVRNVKQASMLEDLLSKLDVKLDAVIVLDVPYDVLLKRAIGRISCPRCKSIYNKFFKKPIKVDVCDNCNEKLVSRNDDNEEAFKVRYQTYLENATPLMDFYDKLNKLIKVDGTKDTDKKISETIKND
ncbi:MAG: nucleoside monophosphate kinase [Bacilli bacterium]|nr:nucleoside monophosphate kinase [Bacilli bacterium]